jgi:Ca2+-binding RTX toxin-like protein
LTVDGTSLDTVDSLTFGGSAFTAGRLTTVDVSDAEADVDATFVTTAPGSSIVTVTTDGGDDTISVDASANNNDIEISSGGGADTISVGFAGYTGSAEIEGGAGNDTITGGAGDDQIDGGSGDDTLAGAGGTNSITTGTGSDTVVGTKGVAFATATADTIEDFTAGAAGDTYQIDISDVKLVVSVTDLTTGNGAPIGAGASSINEIAVGTPEALVAADSLVVMTGGVYANNAAFQADITGDGATSTSDISWAANPGTDDAFMAVYSDGTDSHLVIVADADAADVTLETADITITTVVTLAGIDAIAAGDFVAANFDFIV